MIKNIKDKIIEQVKSKDKLAEKIIDNIIKLGVDGIGPLSSSKSLAEEYIRDLKYKNADERANALIKWESTKNFGTGFVTGLGGLITLPVSIPSSLYSSWIMQARLAGAVALIYGYSTKEERVRTFVLLSIIGESGLELLKSRWLSIANRFAIDTVKSIPEKVFVEINKKIGFKLLNSAGESGAVNLMKLLPVLGGILGGIVNFTSCFITGKTAMKIFSRDKLDSGDKSERSISIHIDDLSKIIRDNSPSVKSIDIKDEKIIVLGISTVPFEIKFKFVESSNGSLTLRLMGNFFKRTAVSMTLKHFVKKMPVNLRSSIQLEGRDIILNINSLVYAGFVNIKGVIIRDIEIDGKYVLIRMEQ